jgi:phage N-6-adenine-methyltransferase
MQKSKAVKHLDIININDEYGTPKKILEQAMIDFKINPTLDVCSSEAFKQFSPKSIKKWYTAEDNALSPVHQWDQDFFMNPPYSKIQKFMEKAYASTQNYNVDALILTYAKTDTKWWHELVEDIAEVHFIRGRINFNDMHGKPRMIYSEKLKKYIKGASPYPSVWIIYRSLKRFRKNG